MEKTQRYVCTPGLCLLGIIVHHLRDPRVHKVGASYETCVISRWESSEFCWGKKNLLIRVSINMRRIKLLKPLPTSTTTQFILDGSLVGFQQPWSMLSPGHSRLPLLAGEPGRIWTDLAGPGHTQDLGYHSHLPHAAPHAPVVLPCCTWTHLSSCHPEAVISRLCPNYFKHHQALFNKTA